MKTALCRSSEFAWHDDPTHVENQRRLIAIDNALQQLGLLDNRTQPEFRAATMEQLARAHEPRYIEALARFADQGGGWLDSDTYAGPRSFDIVALAAGAGIAAVESALDGTAVHGFVLARPPGHHARPMTGMGFCLIDTIAVAAAHALSRGIERIAIVDWDVHHGNGTQEIFYDSDRVSFVSIHQWPLYPGTGAVTETGHGAGVGYTTNFPLAAGTGNEIYLRIFDEQILPKLRAYEPQLVLVSAGYDCHRDDPLGSMQLDEDGFGQMTQRLIDLADETARGRLVLVLEGGYDPPALARSVARTIQVLDGAV